MPERILLSWLLMLAVSPAIAGAETGPYEAYEAGQYDEALSGFVDQQVERPDDPALDLNVGSVHYEMRNYPEADRAFAQAALSPDQSLREEALYNLGNSAYRQGRLEEAVELYKAALELVPDDEDAKFNLEFVRNEIRRRHEEAQKRQQEQQQNPQEQQQHQDQQQKDQQNQQQQQEGESPPETRDSPQQQQHEQGGQDSDQDGLSDQTETSGENPTDPHNPDSDSDGLPDGAEDLNRNGRLDEGETDPNNPDSDGDGLSDGEEAGLEPQTGSGEPESESSEALTAEEANRYLDALEEGRPERRLPERSRRRRPEKDW